MGSTESCEGRRVSFGMDEEERVRVLQGIRLSENVVNRMKDPGQPGPAPCTCAPAHGGPGAPPTESKLPRFESSGGQQPAGVKEDLTRFRQEQASLQDELFQVARREREAAAKHLQAPPPREDPGREKPQPAQLAAELESREAELRRREAFYREQLGRVERKKAEMYVLASQQFHEAAAKAESTITPRRVEPVCPGLQAQILRCYRAHLDEVLRCAELVRAYRLCVSAAHKG